MRSKLDIMSSAWHDSLSLNIHKGNYDYLTVVLHELGHVIGLDHDEDYQKKREILMYGGLRKGKRISYPSKKDMDYIFCEYSRYWGRWLGKGTSYGRRTIEP